jgi:hypothetical protein
MKYQIILCIFLASCIDTCMEMAPALYNACEAVRSCREEILALEQKNMQHTREYESYCMQLEELRNYVRNLIAPGCIQEED